MKTLLKKIFFAGIAATLLFACNMTKDPTEFAPGEVWLDTDGNPINAHGGGIMLHEGTYYWYGEMKVGETYLPECNKSWDGYRVEVTGISCYSSKDLLNWKYEGNVLPAVKDDPDHDLHTSKVLERPKVVYNANTNKFVMWAHVESMDYEKSCSGVAVSDSPTGPFTYIRSMRPNAGFWPINLTEKDTLEGSILKRDYEGGQMARDMTIFVDDDGKAYHFYSSEANGTHHIAELTDDYLDHTGKYKRVFIERFMEAPAVFKHQGKYYFIASDCTGWDPNPARSAVADSIWGPWQELGNPCVGENADKTFISQSTYVIPVQGKENAYIFMADRWNKTNLPDSRYVWLPLTFDDEEKMTINWHANWDLNIFN